jgi:hypothetical protein
LSGELQSDKISGVMALPLLALFASLHLVAPAAAAAEQGFRAQAEEGEEDENADKLGMLNLKLKRGEKTLKHPGTIIKRDEEAVLTFKDGKRVHEVTVFVVSTDEGFKFEVAYTDNGALVLSGETNAKAKQWVKLKSDSGNSWIELQLDPQKKKRDGIDIPDGNNPLDGI